MSVMERQHDKPHVFLSDSFGPNVQLKLGNIVHGLKSVELSLPFPVLPKTLPVVIRWTSRINDDIHLFYIRWTVRPLGNKASVHSVYGLS